MRLRDPLCCIPTLTHCSRSAAVLAAEEWCVAATTFLCIREFTLLSAPTGFDSGMLTMHASSVVAAVAAPSHTAF
eukprot:11859-Heterococcus_DN1.PRE.1